MYDSERRPEIRPNLHCFEPLLPRKRAVPQDLGSWSFGQVQPHLQLPSSATRRPRGWALGLGAGPRLGGPVSALLLRARARHRPARAPPAGGGCCGRWRRAHALSPTQAGSRSRAEAESTVAAAAAAAAAEVARGEGREGGWLGGMDPARRLQRQEPAPELERRRWRRRRLPLPSPPVSECPRPELWLRPQSFAVTPGPSASLRPG